MCLSACLLLQEEATSSWALTSPVTMAVAVNAPLAFAGFRVCDQISKQAGLSLSYVIFPLYLPACIYRAPPACQIPRACWHPVFSHCCHSLAEPQVVVSSPKPTFPLSPEFSESQSLRKQVRGKVI